MNTGEAVVSVGGAEAREALATGDVVNTAARLQTAAPTGRLVGAARRIAPRATSIRYEALDAVEAKGKAEAVEAWLAVEPSLAPAERPARHGPLVGRGARARR